MTILLRAVVACVAIAWLAPGNAPAAEPVLEERTIRVGELVQLGVRESKSELVEVQAEGDAVRVIHEPLTGALALQGVHPGTATVRVHSTFALFRDPEAKPRLQAQLSIQVTPAHSRHLGEARPIDPATIPPPRATTAGDWEGPVSLQAEELSTVISDAAAWTALWRSAFGLPAPAVDFSAQVVACVFLGHRADWIYRIMFDEPRREARQSIIEYGLVKLVLELAGPIRPSGQYRMKSFPREPGRPVILAEDLPSAPGRPPSVAPAPASPP